MPVALVDGKAQIVPEVVDKMIAVDPVHDLDRYLSQPERLRAISLFHGAGDQMVPVELARSFDRLLSNQGIEHEYVEVNGGHCEFYFFGPMVQFMSDHLVGATPKTTAHGAAAVQSASVPEVFVRGAPIRLPVDMRFLIMFGGTT